MRATWGPMMKVKWSMLKTLECAVAEGVGASKVR